MSTSTDQKARAVLKQLLQDKDLARFVNADIPLSTAYCGSSEIKLIVLGQDPTIKNASGRAQITIALNLRGYGALWNYLAGICKGLQLDLRQHEYATNYYKNFFIRPPTQIDEINIFERFADRWLPLLQDEISQFNNVPIISLGQPLLSALVRNGASPLVRDYWGYTPDWKEGKRRPYRFLRPDENVLGRLIFPFPHQPSIRKQFYRERLMSYTAFVKRVMHGK